MATPIALAYIPSCPCHPCRPGLAEDRPFVIVDSPFRHVSRIFGGGEVMHTMASREDGEKRRRKTIQLMMAERTVIAVRWTDW